MANAHANKVVINGATKIDLTADTVTAAHLESGYTAHDKSGAKVTGTLVVPPRLPEGLQEVEYLLANGGQWINVGEETTGVDIRAKAKVLFTSGHSAEQAFFGRIGLSGIEAGKDGNQIFLWQTRDSIYWTHPSPYNTVMEIDVRVQSSKPNIELIVDGVSRGTSSWGATASTPSDITLFSHRETVYPMYGRMYYCKIWKSGSLVRDLVPCYRKYDMKPGMYDLYAGGFYTNAGSDDFTTGPIVQ